MDGTPGGVAANERTAYREKDVVAKAERPRVHALLDETEEALHRAHARLEATEAAVNELEDRLGPILGPVLPQPGEMAEKRGEVPETPVESPVAERVRGVARMVHDRATYTDALRDRIANITARLEV